jgi:hypothetical protein
MSVGMNMAIVLRKRVLELRNGVLAMAMLVVVTMSAVIMVIVG